VVVDKDGGYSLKLPEGGAERVDLATLGLRLKAVHDANPAVAVFVGGDAGASYDSVYQAMSYISAAGVESVSLMSKPNEGR
jgi:biopolymer transport protein ExbD